MNRTNRGVEKYVLQGRMEIGVISGGLHSNSAVVAALESGRVESGSTIQTILLFWKQAWSLWPQMSSVKMFLDCFGGLFFFFSKKSPVQRAV